MTEFERIKKLDPPAGTIDVILDTDAYNEIDDQFAISYMLSRSDKLRVRAITAAPFFHVHNHNSTSARDGMKKSYNEIQKLLTLAKKEDLSSRVFRGSENFLQDEVTPVESPAAREMVAAANEHTSDDPLYIVAIGAITNVASAILLCPEMVEKTVLVWLGGHADFWQDTNEFNMCQDVAAARVVFGCGIPLIQLPCMGVVDRFDTTEPELRHRLSGKSKLCDYLVENTCAAANSYASGKPWSRVIWDVTAVAWLTNESGRFMSSKLMPAPIPEYDHHYGFDPRRHMIRAVTWINRTELFAELFDKLSKM